MFVLRRVVNNPVQSALDPSRALAVANTEGKLHDVAVNIHLVPFVCPCCGQVKYHDGEENYFIITPSNADSGEPLVHAVVLARRYTVGDAMARFAILGIIEDDEHRNEVLNEISYVLQNYVCKPDAKDDLNRLASYVRCLPLTVNA